jgi:hypothetical protein
MAEAALAAMEARAVRDKRRATFSPALGYVSVSLAGALWLVLPPLWRVLNGEWSARILPSLLALGGHAAMALAAVVALKCAQVQGNELLDEFYAKVGSLGGAVRCGGFATDILDGEQYLSHSLQPGNGGGGAATVDRAAACM